MRIAKNWSEFIYCTNEGSEWGFCYANPLDIAKDFWPDADMSHITFDPNIDHEYKIIRQGGGDGTLSHTLDTLANIFRTLENKCSYYIPNPVQAKGYKVGWISHVKAYGKVELRCGGKYPGLTERFTMPVKCIN